MCIGLKLVNYGGIHLANKLEVVGLVSREGNG